jgi:hypothetical protein
MGWDSNYVTSHRASSARLHDLEGFSWIRVNLDGWLLTLIGLANGCIRVEPRASWSKGQGWDVPLKVPLKPHTWFPDRSSIRATRCRPFEGLPWSSYIEDLNIDFVAPGVFAAPRCDSRGPPLIAYPFVTSALKQGQLVSPGSSRGIIIEVITAK